MGRAEHLDASNRVYANVRLVRFTEMEYGIPREHAAEALERVLALIERRRLPIGFPIELRVVAPDDALLSTAHGRPTAYIAVHQYLGMEYETYFRGVEAIMDDYGGRPHWGKRHYQSARHAGRALPGVGALRGGPRAARPGGPLRERLHARGCSGRSAAPQRQRRRQRAVQRDDAAVARPDPRAQRAAADRRAERRARGPWRRRRALRKVDRSRRRVPDTRARQRAHGEPRGRLRRGSCGPRRPTAAPAAAPAPPARPRRRGRRGGS